MALPQLGSCPTRRQHQGPRRPLGQTSGSPPPSKDVRGSSREGIQRADMAGHEGVCFSPGGADSLILLPFLSWTRRQMSGKSVHIDFLNCPHPEDGMGDVIHCGAATFNLPCASDPPGERWGNRVLLGVSNSGGLDGPEPAFLTGSRARRKPHSEDHHLDRVVKVQGADTVNGRRSWPVTQSLQRTVAATSTGATEAKSAGHPGAAE